MAKNKRRYIAPAAQSDGTAMQSYFGVEAGLCRRIKVTALTVVFACPDLNCHWLKADALGEVERLVYRSSHWFSHAFLPWMLFFLTSTKTTSLWSSLLGAQQEPISLNTPSSVHSWLSLKKQPWQHSMLRYQNSGIFCVALPHVGQLFSNENLAKFLPLGKIAQRLSDLEVQVLVLQERAL